MRKRNFRFQPVNIVSAKLLLSYLSILAVPLAAIVFIYATASNLLYTVQQERMYASLSATAQETQQHLEEAANLGIHISTTPALAAMQKRLGPGTRASFFEMYTLSRTFPDYTLFNSAIQDIYFFFNEQDYVIRLPVVVPATERSYRTLGSLLADDYNTMVHFVSAQYRDMEITELPTNNPENQLLGVMQSFPFSAKDRPLGTLLVLLNDTLMNEKLRANLVNGQGMVVMLDSAGGLIKSVAGEQGVPFLTRQELAKLSHAPFSTLRHKGVSYAVCYAESHITGQSFFSIVPKAALLQRVGFIKVIIALLSILSVFIGLFTCVLLWSRRRSLALRYSRYQNEFGTAAGAKTNNMWEGLHTILDSVAQMQTTMQLQSGLVRSGVMQRLLKGEYNQRSSLEDDLVGANIQLDGAIYYVATITFNRGFHNTHGETINEFRLRMLRLVREKLDIPNHCCEPEDLFLALVIPASGPESLEIIKRELRDFEDGLVAAEHVEAYIGVGSGVQDVMFISHSYHEARSVCEYLRFYNIRRVMSYNDMPVSHDAFYFPLEMELRFIRAIEQGSHNELQELFSQLAVENFATRQLSFETQMRLLEMVRCTAVRALRQDDAAAPSAHTVKFLEILNHADSLEQIFVLLEEMMPEAARKTTQQKNRKTEEKREKIRAHIKQNYHREDYTIHTIAQDMAVSETKFYKDFRQLFGVSFSEYLESTRIERACALFKERLRIKDVSALVGYSSDYSFRRAFKRVMDITPSAYMENIKK